MPRYIEVVPAYDRDYTSKAAVQADWDSGKDFATQDLFVRGMLNCDDATDEMVVNVRYDKMTKVHVIDVGKWRASDRLVRIQLRSSPTGSVRPRTPSRSRHVRRRRKAAP